MDHAVTAKKTAANACPAMIGMKPVLNMYAHHAACPSAPSQSSHDARAEFHHAPSASALVRYAPTP